LHGEVLNGKVTPFGTSAHIPFSKKHIGKKIKIVVPDETLYVWVFSEKERKEFVEACLKELEKNPEGRLAFHKRSAIKNILESEFDIDNLAKAVEILKGNKKYERLVQKIKKVYSL